MKLYNLGSVNIDYVYRVPHFLQPGETLSATDRNIFPGGKGLNQSVAAARAGATVVHGAVVGREAGFLVDLMRNSHVDTDRIEITDKPAGHTVIQVAPNGQNCILLFAGTNAALTREYIEKYLADAAEGDILLLQNETNCLAEAFELAAEKKMSIAFNPSPFDESLLTLPLNHIKWWFCNEIEAAAIFGSDDPEIITERFREKYPNGQLVLTLGENGSRLITHNETVVQPIFKVKAVDTTGAGDTFTGCFLSAVMAGCSGTVAMRRAAKASAIAVSRAGAAVSIPTADEVDE